jgi:hypothetical protein
VGAMFFFRDFRNGWPLLLVSSFFVLNELIRIFLTKFKMIQALTEFVGSLNQTLTFIGGFAVVFALLAATGILNLKPSNSVQTP